MLLLRSLKSDLPACVTALGTKKLVGDTMRDARFYGRSRSLLRFSIFTLLTVLVALSIAGCIGATGATKPSADSKTPSITTDALVPGTMNQAYSTFVTAEGGVKPYHWSLPAGKLPAGVGLTTATGEIQGTPKAVGTTSFVVKVSDSSPVPQTSSQTLTLTISGPEAVLQISTASLPAGLLHSEYSATLQAEGGTAPYTWSMAGGTFPTGLTLSAAGVISGIPTKSSTFAFSAEVTDSSSLAKKTSTRQFTVAIDNTTAVEITTGSLTAGKEGAAYSATLQATGGKSPYTWTRASGRLPGGLSLASDGVISGTPTRTGSFSFSVEVHDSSSATETATKAFVLEVGAAPSSSLTIVTTTLAAGTQNLPYSATIVATGGTRPYKWTATGGSLPAGITLGGSGVLSGAPTATGTFDVLVEVQDTSSPVQTASRGLRLVIAAAGSKLAITTAAVSNAKVNSTYSLAMAAAGGKTPYAWSLPSGSLPAGLTFSSAGVLSGMPKAAGSFTFMSEVQDSETPPQVASRQFSFSVTNAAAPITTLIVSTATVPSGKVSTAYSTSLAATGGTAPYSWSMPAGALPKGLSLSSSGAISGTPTASGSFTFVAEVSDSGSPVQTAQMTYSLTISGTTAGTVAITTSSLASGKINTAYSASLAASGGTTPYKWSVTSGSLNTGLSLSSSGAISGTPTAAGTSSFTVQVTDSGSPALTATQNFGLTIASNTSTLAISTTSVADGQMGASYSATVAATGGTVPYTWSLTSGTLPAGLALGASTGTISGSPTASGTSSFTLKVTDSSSPAQTASQSFSIAVSAAASGTNVTACGTLANAGTTYVLQNDVSAAQSCFSIQASNITLNLNGHTVTYNTGSNSGAFGISGIACWDTENPSGNACGGSFDGFTVYGGAIVEGSGTTGTFSHCIRMGQGLNSGPTVHDTTFTFSSNSAMGIYVDYAGSSVPGGAVVYNNTFNNNVTTIVSRQDIDGTSIRIDQGPSVTTGAQIYNNTIIGGPQGGILDEAIGGAIYGNTIKQGTVGSNQYTNDFSIYAWEQNISVHNNTIAPTQGRGISLDSSAYAVNGTSVASNTVTVTESNDNSEYGGCPLGGVYGIQYDDNASSASDTGNTVVANALKCPAVGFRLTAYGSGDTSSNNSYSGKLLGGFASGVTATGLSLDSGGQPAFTATRDTFIGDTSSVYVDWDGAGPFTCISCTLGSGPTPTGYTTFYFWNGGTSVTPGGVHFRDTTFTGSASKTSTSMTVPGNNGQTAEYWIDWTYTVTVEDGTGAAVSGAAVSIKDALGNSVFSGTTNSSGQASAVLTELRMHNSGTSAVEEMHTPDAVTISASGCTTLSYSTTISGTTSETRSMSGTCSN